MRHLMMIVGSVFIFSVLFGGVVQAQRVVNVGGYEFPPYVEDTKPVSGLTLDLLAALNAFQTDYTFQFVLTSSKRRYLDFESGRFDMLMFESLAWGWQDKAVEATRVFLHDGEVYLTKADGRKNQAYFDDFAGKSVIGYLGYHYGFANFNADQKILQDRYNTTVTTSHAGNIRMVLAGLTDIAVITKSYLQKYLLEYPAAEKQLLISEKLDQAYNHTILVRQNIRPSAADLNILLDKMEAAGLLQQLWEKYGIQ